MPRLNIEVNDDILRDRPILTLKEKGDRARHHGHQKLRRALLEARRTHLCGIPSGASDTGRDDDSGSENDYAAD